MQQISILPLCQEILVPALPENTFRIWRPHHSVALNNSNQPKCSLAGCYSLFKFYFLLPEELNQALLPNFLAYSSVFLLINLEQCYCFEKVVSKEASASLSIAIVLEIMGRTEVRGQGQQNGTALNKKIKERELLFPQEPLLGLWLVQKIII